MLRWDSATQGMAHMRSMLRRDICTAVRAGVLGYHAAQQIRSFPGSFSPQRNHSPGALQALPLRTVAQLILVLSGLTAVVAVRYPYPVALAQVNALEGRLVLSERAAMLETVAAALNPGDVVEGVVSRLADYGAFVSLRSPDGDMHGVEARTHGFGACLMVMRSSQCCCARLTATFMFLRHACRALCSGKPCIITGCN